MPADTAELIALTSKLLQSIDRRDWATYSELCDDTLSAFEPEARGALVEGMEFHKFYFDLPMTSPPGQSTIASPHVRQLGPDTAVVSYVRLVQKLDEAGAPRTKAFEETRVWQRIGGVWKHVHFHRSLAG